MPRTYNVYVYVDGDNGHARRPANYTLSGPGLTPTTIKVINHRQHQFFRDVHTGSQREGQLSEVHRHRRRLRADGDSGARRRESTSARQCAGDCAGRRSTAAATSTVPGQSASTSSGAARSAWTPARSQAGRAANWNNANEPRSTPQRLVDETGTSTTAAIVWRANGVWMTSISDQPGNRRMMKGNLDTSSTSVTTLSATGLLARDHDGRRRGSVHTHGHRHGRPARAHDDRQADGVINVCVSQDGIFFSRSAPRRL